MNKYRIIVLSYGRATEIVILAFDIISAINGAGIMPGDVVKAELIGSTDIDDRT